MANHLLGVHVFIQGEPESISLILKPIELIKCASMYYITSVSISISHPECVPGMAPLCSTCPW